MWVREQRFCLVADASLSVREGVSKYQLQAELLWGIDAQYMNATGIEMHNTVGEHNVGNRPPALRTRAAVEEIYFHVTPLAGEVDHIST